MRSLGLGGGVGANIGAARHERGHAVVGGLPGRVFDLPQDLLVLGVRILEVRGFALQDRYDRNADRRGEHEYRAGDQQNAPRALGREPCKLVDHGASWSSSIAVTPAAPPLPGL